MKKSFWILISVVVLLIAAALFLYPRKNYAGIQMSVNQYQKIQRSKGNINKVVSALEEYRPRNEKTVKNISRKTNILVSENGDGLSSKDFSRLKTAVGKRDNGLLRVVYNAFKKNYIFSSEIASVMQEKFNIIDYESAKAIVNSNSEAKKISNKFERELDINKRLYSLENNG